MRQRHVGMVLLGLAVCLLGSGLAYHKLPSPSSRCQEPEARQFDFWLGTWEVENRQRSPSRPTDPTWLPTGTFRTHVASRMDGCVLVEQSWGDLVYGPISGVSLRAFDPQKKRWVVVNHWSVGGAPPSFSTWEGAFHHGRIDGFDTTRTASGALQIDRSTFSDVTDSTFRWDAATSTDSTLTWKPHWIMEGRRTATHETLPAATEVQPVCSDRIQQTVDALLGAWHGTVVHSQEPALPTGTSVTFTADGLHGGCALLTLLRADAESYQRIALRAPEPSGDAWVQYSYDTSSRAFTRLEGPKPDVVAHDGDASAQPAVRETWVLPETDRLTVRLEAWDTVEDRWHPHVEILLTRPVR